MSELSLQAGRMYTLISFYHKMKLSSRELTGIKSDFKDHALPTLVCQPKWHSTREFGAVQVPGDARDGYRAGVSVTAMLLWS